MLASNADTINVPKGAYTLSAQFGELLLVSDHIVGAGARDVFIDGAHETRLMRVADGSSTVAGVTLRNGNGQDDVSPGFGGAVFVQAGGTLTLTNSTVSGNAVTGTAAGGGGIAAAGSLALIGSTVSGTSRARVGRRAAAASRGRDAVLGNTTVTGNTASDTAGGTASRGGGIAASSTFLRARTQRSPVTRRQRRRGLPRRRPRAARKPLTDDDVGSNTAARAATGLTTDSTHNNIGFDTDVQFTGHSRSQQHQPGSRRARQQRRPTSTPSRWRRTARRSTKARVARPPTTSADSPGRTDRRCLRHRRSIVRRPDAAYAMAVTNDAGGTRAAGDFTVHVRSGAADVKGSPAPGLVDGRRCAEPRHLHRRWRDAARATGVE